VILHKRLRLNFDRRRYVAQGIEPHAWRHVDWTMVLRDTQLLIPIWCADLTARVPHGTQRIGVVRDFAQRRLVEGPFRQQTVDHRSAAHDDLRVSSQMRLLANTMVQ
jgi:hypothetical protein